MPLTGPSCSALHKHCTMSSCCNFDHDWSPGSTAACECNEGEQHCWHAGLSQA